MSVEARLPHTVAPPATSPKEAPETTRDRLLDAAEAIFAERGFAGTSMRAVTQRAGLSVSAANYHFGSKRALIVAALERLVVPLNDERIAAVEAVVAAAGAARPDPEAILAAFVRPLYGSRAEERARYRAVVSRLFVEGPEVAADLRAQLFGSLTRHVVDALVRALPDDDRSDIAVGLQFVLGAIMQSSRVQLGPVPAGGAPPGDAELAVRMPAFGTAGLRAYLDCVREGRA